MSDLIPAGARVVIARDVLSTELGGEHVILHPVEGIYYGVDDVAADVWKLLQAPVSLEAICEWICSTYDVDADRCRRDVLRLLAELRVRKLIELIDQDSTA